MDFEANNNIVATKTALVVDDSEMIRKINGNLLRNLGIENYQVENGKEAIDICSERSFDLILMDKDMPIMNGIEATKQLRAMGICSAIAGVSSISEAKDVEEFMEAGLDDFQEKPLNKAKLIAILNKINRN